MNEVSNTTFMQGSPVDGAAEIEVNLYDICERHENCIQ